MEAIAEAARRLVELRDAWLNPPTLLDGGGMDDLGPALPLQQRTLTNLYNRRPDWLAEVHGALDRAVLAAYGWPEGLSDDEILGRLLALNGERAAGGTGTSDGTDNT